MTKSALYHDDGSIRLTMVDVQRLLPEDRVIDFNDLRRRHLLMKLELRLRSYLKLGGDMANTGTGATGLGSPNLCLLSSLHTITRVTGHRPGPLISHLQASRSHWEFETSAR